MFAFIIIDFNYSQWSKILIVHLFRYYCKLIPHQNIFSNLHKANFLALTSLKNCLIMYH